jgi:hypothetical protein
MATTSGSKGRSSGLRAADICQVSRGDVQQRLCFVGGASQRRTGRTQWCIVAWRGLC